MIDFNLLILFWFPVLLVFAVIGVLFIDFLSDLDGK